MDEDEKEVGGDSTEKAENSDYLLVLNNHKDEKKIDEVKNVVESWASGD